jgi:hypothetical protein
MVVTMKFMFLIGAFLQATINYAFAKCEPDLILLGGESAKISVVEPDTGCFQIGKKYYR